MESLEIHIGGKYRHHSGQIHSEAFIGSTLYSDWHGGHPATHSVVVCVTLYSRSRNRGLKMGSLACKGNPRKFICEL
ncbi:hypothetical protein ElyMa_006354900 [Elysia marginata]|uniref:C-type lectin domain-containing protein n=1 Tax=Elysia marginata TaxID=1093978 RepID=A0AAV4HPI6_9GAST|nr:hypothetical protein ElyMa_006354900 [Elysia marginata]